MVSKDVLLYTYINIYLDSSDNKKKQLFKSLENNIINPLFTASSWLFTFLLKRKLYFAEPSKRLGGEKKNSTA